MLAFFSLSTGPGPDIKQFAIGLAAGVIFDATVIRALLVPVDDAAARPLELDLPAARRAPPARRATRRDAVRATASG